ncbi:MAG: GreA/GreB family elongation factor [Chloroflexi bacterium]|nr:GreA/GreB family elongation factor [Chloroflexota bacterium]
MAVASEQVSTNGHAHPTVLNDALVLYMREIAPEDRKRVQAELSRFLRWVGGGRKAGTLAAPEIGEYSDLVSARGTAPDAVTRLEVVKKFLGYLKKQGLVEVSLAQHLRLRKGRTATGRRNQSTVERTVVRLTKAGHTELLSRLAGYRDERRQLADDIHRAAADKDVRENAPLEAAREAQGLLQSKITEIEATLKAAVVIEEHGSDQIGSRIRLGSTIVLQEQETGRTTTCQIVAPSEASPLQSKISSASPVGAAVLGRGPGDAVKVRTPRGVQVYTIVKTV